MSEISDGRSGTPVDGAEEVTLTERQLWELAAGESVTVEVVGDHVAEEPVPVAVVPPVPPVPSSRRE